MAVDEGDKKALAAAIQREDERRRRYLAWAEQGRRAVAEAGKKPEWWFFPVTWGSDENRPAVDSADRGGRTLARECCYYSRDERMAVLAIPFRPGHFTACLVAQRLHLIHSGLPMEEMPMPTTIPPEGAVIRSSAYVEATWGEVFARHGWNDREELEFYESEHKAGDTNVPNEPDDRDRDDGEGFRRFLQDKTIPPQEKIEFLEALAALVRQDIPNAPPPETVENTPNADDSNVLNTLSMPERF